MLVSSKHFHALSSAELPCGVRYLGDNVELVGFCTEIERDSRKERTEWVQCDNQEGFEMVCGTLLN